MHSTPRTPYSKADWRRSRDLYKQVSGIINDPEKQNVPPERLLGALAESLGRTFSFYDGFEDEFIDDLLSIWCEIDGHCNTKVANFRTLYYDQRFDRIPEYNPPPDQPDQRRRPKPFEAAVETCRRLVDLNQVYDVLRDLPTCGIVGGSASYGRFYNVCGDPTDKPSDLDLLLLLPQYESIDGVVDALKKMHGIDDTSLGAMRARARIFPRIRKGLEHCIFSHNSRSGRRPMISDWRNMESQVIICLVHTVSRGMTLTISF